MSTTEKINKGNPLENTSCPVHMDELKRLYVDMEYSCAEIGTMLAKRTGRNKAFCDTIVGKWLKKIEVELRSLSQAHCVSRSVRLANNYRRRECPVSKEYLFDLFWRQGKSLSEVAVHLSALLDDNVNHYNVEQWLKVEGISLRSKSQSQKLAFKKNPYLRESAAERLKASVAKARSEGKLIGKCITMQSSAKGRRRAVKIYKSRQVHVICACGCKREKDIPVYQTRRSKSGLVFFSRPCVFKYYNKQRSLNALRTVKPSVKAEYTLEQLARMSEQELTRITSNP